MKILLSVLAAASLLVACSSEKTYTIEGSFNIPLTYQLPDTVLTRGPIEGYVYMLDLDGQPLDSAQIIDEKFTFTGIADPEKPYFAYLVSEYAAGMFVIEPGTMTAVIGEPVTITGTATNDEITALMSRVDTIGYMLYDEMQALQDQNPDSTINPEVLMSAYERCSNMVANLVDSVYQANKDNLLGVYCVNVKTAQVQSVAELDSMLNDYSDYIKNSELIQQHRKYLLGDEAQDNGGEDNLGY